MKQQHGPTSDDLADDVIAANHGVPRWITPELIADTISTWQPYYAAPLTAEDAREILCSVADLFDVLDTLQ